MGGKRSRLGELLLASGLIDKAKLTQALGEILETGEVLGEALRIRYNIPEHEIYRALAQQRGVLFTTADELLPITVSELANRVPHRFRDLHKVIPIRLEDDKLIAATCDPALDIPELCAPFSVHSLELRLVTPTDYQRLRVAIDLGQTHQAEVEHPITAADLSHAEEAVDEEAIRLFDAILLEAVAARASDVHYEVYGIHPRLRIRVDGDLRDLGHLRLTNAQFTTLVNVGKVRAKMDIAERRAPQGGASTFGCMAKPSMSGPRVNLHCMASTWF